MPSRYGIAVFHGIGDILNCTPVARQLKLNEPDCLITWFTSERGAMALEHNPHVDEVVALPGDPVKLDERVLELKRLRPWTRFLTPAPYMNYQAAPGGSLFEILRASAGIPLTVPFRPVLRLREDEIREARAYWESLPGGPRILVETEFYSQQSRWNRSNAFDLVERLAPVSPLLVFTARTCPEFLDDLREVYPRAVWCQAPFRQNAELYNLCDAFIGVSSGITCLTISTHCRDDIPSIEYVRAEHWASAHWDFVDEHTYCFTYARFLAALDGLAARLQGRDHEPDFRSPWAPLSSGASRGIEVRCPNCGTNRWLPHWLGASLVQCRACDMVYARLKEISTEATPQMPDSEGLLPLRRAQLRDVGPDIPPQARVVEFGCRDLAFRRACEEAGHTFIAFDAPVSLADGRTINATPFREAALPEGSADLVACFHGLQQDDHPGSILEKAAHVLRVDGALLVTTPNLESLCASFLGPNWPWAAGQAVLLDRKMLRNLLFEAGFALTFCTTTSGEFGTSIPRELIARERGVHDPAAQMQILERLEAIGKGEEILVIARRRGRFKGRIPSVERPFSCGQGLFRPDTRGPLGTVLAELMAGRPQFRAVRTGVPGREQSRTLLASLYRALEVDPAGLLDVEHVAPGTAADFDEINDWGLAPWVVGVRSGTTLDGEDHAMLREEIRVLPQEDPIRRSLRFLEASGSHARWNHRLLREALKEHAWRPDLVLLDTPGPLGLRELNLTLGLLEGPCMVLVQGTYDLPQVRRIQRVAAIGDYRLLEVDPGPCEPKPILETITLVLPEDMTQVEEALGLLPALASAHPEARLVVVCGARQVGQARTNRYAQDVLPCPMGSLDGGSAFPTPFLEALLNVRTDLAINLEFPRTARGDLVVASSGAPMRYGFRLAGSVAGTVDQVAREGFYSKLVTVPAGECLGEALVRLHRELGLEPSARRTLAD